MKRPRLRVLPLFSFLSEIAEKILYHTATLSWNLHCTVHLNLSAYLISHGNKTPSAEQRSRCNQHRPVKFQTRTTLPIRELVGFANWITIAHSLAKYPQAAAAPDLFCFGEREGRAGGARGKGQDGGKRPPRRLPTATATPRGRARRQPANHRPVCVRTPYVRSGLTRRDGSPHRARRLRTPTCARAAGPIAAPRPMWRLSLSAPGPYVAGVALPAALCDENIRRLSRHCLQYMHA